MLNYFCTSFSYGGLSSILCPLLVGKWWGRERELAAMDLTQVFFTALKAINLWDNLQYIQRKGNYVSFLKLNETVVLD